MLLRKRSSDGLISFSPASASLYSLPYFLLAT